MWSDEVGIGSKWLQRERKDGERWSGGWCFQGISVQNRRPSNMDCILCRECSKPGGALLLAAVSDGVGSAKDGGFSSAYAIDALSKWMERTDSIRLGLSLRDRILKINQEIIEIARQKQLVTAATLSVLLLYESQYVLVHIGDSRIYQCGQNGLLQLTHDDVSDTGRLTGCIGHWEQITVQYEEREINDSVFLLCTDGLYKHLALNELWKKLSVEKERRKQDFLEKLADYVIDQGETDNISAVLIQKKK